MIERLKAFTGYFYVFIAGAFLGAAVCALWPHRQAVETAQPAVRQYDGSLVLERNPAATPPAKIPIPDGGKRERAIHVDVQPTAPGCPVCQVDLSLIGMPDGSHRVVASSTTGTVLKGLDIPLIPVDRGFGPWAAGPSHGNRQNSWGIWIDRDFERLRIGFDVNKVDGNRPGLDAYEGRIRLGVRF